MREILVDNAIHRLSISPSVLEIFVLKVHAGMDGRTNTPKNNASSHYVVVGGGIKKSTANQDRQR